MTWGGMDSQKVALHPAQISKTLGYSPYADFAVPTIKLAKSLNPVG